MDLESCGHGSFYGNLDELIPTSDNYSFDDIEEILRSTDSHLDSSIDLNNLTPHNIRDFEIPFKVELDNSSSESVPTLDEINFGLPLSSTKEERPEIFMSAYESQRTSSISSMDEDSFNPDDFINFLRKDDFKMDFLNENELRQRNTPSPTGSCSSSGGSSTSGVQSDVSSVASRSQTYMEVDSDIKAENNFSDTVRSANREAPVIEHNEDKYCTPIHAIPPEVDRHKTIICSPANTNKLGVSTMPLIVPVVPINTNATNTISACASTMQSLQQIQPISVLSSTLIPVKALPLKVMTQVSSNIQSMASEKNGPKLAPKANINNSSNTVKTALATTANVSKVVPPLNSKPKTVFLTMSDYKALTQLNGRSGKVIGATTPKIILKTASGKVITANKIVPSALGVPSNFVPKVIKTINGPVVIKQQSSKISHGGSSILGTTGKPSMSNGPTSLSVYKGLIDEKMWKKQQRMIKNRESASLSRKKKKEYVVSLESRINDLEKENCTLEGENSSLRSQLVALAQSCQCKNSNISEFVLNALDINTKICGSDQHVKISPKPTLKNLKQRMTAANVKKNIAILFAMAFMVSMNVGNFNNYMNKNTIENSIESAAISSDEPVATGRRLLWVETESEFKQKMNNTKHEAEMDVPPLHFLHTANRSRAAALIDQNHNISTKEMPSSTNKCGSGSNYTENHRLHRNLHKWIDVNDNLNLSFYKKHRNVLGNSLQFGKFESDYFDRKPLQLPLQDSLSPIKMKRKVIMTPPLVQSKLPKFETAEGNKMDDRKEFGSEKNSLDIFQPRISEEYLRLFKGIKRQDDTFYVLSFNMDHILLPASAYNKSARPKMSLLLPAGDPSVNGDVTLMQIDCEVVNTTELELKSFMIPEKLRPQKFGNDNFHPKPNPNDMVNNETRSREQQRKAKGQMPEMPKQKSPPKTYYMLGPRSAAAAAAMKKKPTLVRLGSNESIDNITANDENNSTILTKLQNTLG